MLNMQGLQQVEPKTWEQQQLAHQGGGA